MTTVMNPARACRCCGEPILPNDRVYDGKNGWVHWGCYERGHGDHCKHPIAKADQQRQADEIVVEIAQQDRADRVATYQPCVSWAGQHIHAMNNMHDRVTLCGASAYAVERLAKIEDVSCKRCKRSLAKAKAGA